MGIFLLGTIVVRPDEYHAEMYNSLKQGQTVSILAGNQEIKVKVNALEKYGLHEYRTGKIWGEVVLPDNVGATMDMRRVGDAEEYVLTYDRGQMAIPTSGAWPPCDCEFALILSLPAQ